MDERWPTTIPEAVNQLLTILSPEDQETIHTIPQGDVVTSLHASVGAYIRNSFGLWDGNQALLDECQAHDADRAAAVILQALWEHVNHDTAVVRELLADLEEPEETWESPILRQARSTCDATRQKAGLPPAPDGADCPGCEASGECELE